MSEEEKKLQIDEILDKLSRRKSATLLQCMRECQLKKVEHPFITREEYIDKILNYIKDLQQKVEQLEKDSIAFKKLNAWIVNRHAPDLFHKMEILDKLKELKEDNKNV